MSDKEPPPEPTDWSHIPTQFIPEDDPIYSEGVIITFPIKRNALVSPPPDVGVDEETYHRQLDEALKREDASTETSAEDG